MTDRSDIRRAGASGRARSTFITTVREILSRQHGHPIEREQEIRSALAEMDRRLPRNQGRTQ